jgi:hypothetical protein
VQHVIGFVHGATNRFQVIDAALDERNFVADFGEIVFLAGREIVQDDDAFAAANQFIDGVGADKSRAASDDVSHSSHPPFNSGFAKQTLKPACVVRDPPPKPVGSGEKAESFPKTRENASGNLKQRARKDGSRDSVVYDESRVRTIFKTGHVAGKL